ncbi:5'/3'-nucleotidase SurE [uncultured Sphingomonas sp.]|uniref:5'/3'-nucleotidase SurE n=1 Tax=uncultured Sphingomonas sp. TaxID=158754 RepID=UPI0035CA8A8D
MRILLCNDDGIHAKGLAVLERLARTFSDDVWIVAPADEQSGKGRSLTLSQPVRLRRFDDRRFSVSGTPTDAVMMALGEVMKDHRPDLIMSGVNRGANLGEDVFYSGTVGAAMEGTLAGIRAIALSQRYREAAAGDDVDFGAAEQWGERVLRPLLDARWAPGTLINVNFPPVDSLEVKGIRVVHQGLRDYGRQKVVRRDDPRGFAYYWMGLGKVPHTPVADTDLEAIALDYITLTPLHMDLTHRESLELLTALYR